MENSALFVQVEQKLNKKYECEIETIDSFLKGTEEIIEFMYNEEFTGLYSTKLNKVIYEPEICSDIEFNSELGLISLYSWSNNKLIWIDLLGRVILEDGKIIQSFLYDFYYIEKNYYAESSSIGTTGYSTYELYKPNFGSYLDDDQGGPKIRGILDAVPDFSGRYLMIKLENNLKEKLIGVYDLKELKWICETKQIYGWN